MYLLLKNPAFSSIIILGLLRRCNPFLHQGLGITHLFLARAAFSLDDQAEHPAPYAEAFVCCLEA